MDLLEASGHAKRLGQLFKSIEVIGQTMEEIGSLEQYEKEVKARTVAAEKKEKVAIGELSRVEILVRQAHQDLESMVQLGKEQSKELVDSAKQKADSILAEAKQAKDKIASQIKDMEAKLVVKQQELTQATTDLATMQKKIADTKTQIQQLLRA